VAVLHTGEGKGEKPVLTTDFAFVLRTPSTLDEEREPHPHPRRLNGGRVGDLSRQRKGKDELTLCMRVRPKSCNSFANNEE